MLGAAVFVSCLLLGPREVNGDGIGYLKAVRSVALPTFAPFGRGVPTGASLYPGHLLYVPLLRLACWLARAHDPLGCVLPCRVVSALGAAIAAVCCGLLARRTLVGVAFAASAGMIGAGCDIECYAPAVAALLGCVLALDRRRDALAGVLLALAVLLHIENALFVLPALLLCRRRVVLLASAASIVAIIAFAVGARPSSLPQASHGFHYPLHVYTPAIALWGAARTLVFAPYAYEASWPRVIAPTLASLVVVVLARPTSPMPRAVLLAWLVPYSIVGMLFFPSDPERWLFVLPLFWLAARPRAWLVVALAITNVALWTPIALDRTHVDRARSAASFTRPGDLVIMPGHGWDESIALYAPDVRPFPLVFHTAARGGRAGLDAALDEALRDSSHVVSVRLDEDDSPLGWKELAPYGLDHDAIVALLRAHGLEPDVRRGPLRAWIRTTLNSR